MEQLKYKIIDTTDDFSEFLVDLYNQDHFVFDFETNGLETHTSSFKIVGLGFSWAAYQAYYIPFNGSLDPDQILRAVGPVFENDTKRKIGHNLKFDARVLDRFNIKVRNLYFDTMIASFCIHGDTVTHNLDDLTLRYFNHIKIRTKSLIPKKTKTNQNPSMLDSSIEDVGYYNCEDVDTTYRLFQLFHTILQQEDQAHARKIFYEIDMPLSATLLRMESNGIKLDTSLFEKMRTDFSLEILKLQKEIDDVAGKPVNINAPAQLAHLLFDQLGIHSNYKGKLKQTKSGLSTDKNSLEKFKDNPVVAKILELKQFNTLINKYVIDMPQCISDVTGFIHPFFSQTATATARLAVSEPPCQQIPARTATGKRIREAFISRFDGGKILSIDYSQAELRILSHFSKEPVLVNAYNSDSDVHVAVAAEIIYEKDPTLITKDERTIVKTVNFALLYGARAKKLAETLKIPLEEAQRILDKYMLKMKGVKSFLDTSRIVLKDKGYTENCFGRRRYIPKVYSTDKFEQWAAEREGANNTIQSTNADIIRTAMIRIQDMLDSGNYKSLMVLQVHDELIFDLHPDEIETLPPKISNIMQTVVNFDVVMKAELGIGLNWATAH